jgi:hypothetical protein
VIGYLAVFFLAIALLWALISLATQPSAFQQEHQMRTDAQTQVAIEATRISVLRTQVPTRPPYYGFHP